MREGCVELWTLHHPLGTEQIGATRVSQRPSKTADSAVMRMGSIPIAQGDVVPCERGYATAGHRQVTVGGMLVAHPRPQKT